MTNNKAFRQFQRDFNKDFGHKELEITPSKTVRLKRDKFDGRKNRKK